MTGQLTATCSLAFHSEQQSDAAWVHLLPAGTFTGRDGRGPWRADDPKAIMASTRSFAGPRQIPVDYDHQIDHAEKNGRPAIAAGWIDALQARSDGIWGRVKWTAAASTRIREREYRYLSPVFNYDASGRITRILRAGLTNSPNLHELTALSSSTTGTGNMDQFLSELHTLLELPPEADEAAIMAALRERLTARQSAIDPSQYVPIGDFEKVLAERNALNQGIARQAAMEHVEAQIRNANMPPYLKDWGVALCCSNKPAFDAFIQRTRGHFNILTKSIVPAGSPQSSGAGSLTEDELAVARRMSLTPEEFIKSKSFIETAKD
ncbi:MAG: hypothetical protein KDK75_12255 [Alphaproteobacteria bacterium]|nr:hypothetical protein [Alphaproteobacteria bacterium]